MFQIKKLQRVFSSFWTIKTPIIDWFSCKLCQLYFVAEEKLLEHRWVIALSFMATAASVVTVCACAKHSHRGSAAKGMYEHSVRWNLEVERGSFYVWA